MPPVGNVWSTGQAGRCYFGSIVQPAAKIRTAVAIKESFSISMSFRDWGRGGGTAVIRAVRRVLALRDLAHHHEEHRDHENREEGRRQHPADHARADGVLARRAGAV